MRKTAKAKGSVPSKSNGKGNAASQNALPPAVPSVPLQERPVGTTIHLTGEQHKELTDIDQQAYAVKQQLADLVMAADEIESKIAACKASLGGIRAQMNESASRIVSSYGIKVGDPSLGTWHIDVPRGTIQRRS